ncbi:MAG: hypothetical protein LCH57_01705 [Proteobacteria bacterium]|nr:hypothetical protein [Pseudomonadota bacterium]
MQPDRDGRARLAAYWLDINPGDQFADAVDHLAFRRIAAVAGALQSILEVCDSLCVVFGGAGMQLDRRRSLGLDL